VWPARYAFVSVAILNGAIEPRLDRCSDALDRSAANFFATASVQDA